MVGIGCVVAAAAAPAPDSADEAGDPDRPYVRFPLNSSVCIRNSTMLEDTDTTSKFIKAAEGHDPSIRGLGTPHSFSRRPVSVYCYVA